MTTSGTSSVNWDFATIAEEAYERAGLSMRGGYDLRTARRSLDLISAEWANRGFNLFTIDKVELLLTAGLGFYILPADTIDVIEAVIRTNNGVTTTQSDIIITRISVSTWASIPNKLVQGTPVQYYIDRAVAAPIIWLWEVPDNTITRYLVYWRLRRIQDVGPGAANTADMPFRFVPALISGLAYQIAMKRLQGPEAAQRVPFLKSEYEEAFALAAGEDRDRSSVRFIPGGYDMM